MKELCYRHVWLDKVAPVHVAPFGTFVYAEMKAPFESAELTIEATVQNSGLQLANYRLVHVLFDADGQEVARCEAPGSSVA